MFKVHGLNKSFRNDNFVIINEETIAKQLRVYRNFRAIVRKKKLYDCTIKKSAERDSEMGEKETISPLEYIQKLENTL